MTTCPRCGSNNKHIKQYPYCNKNVRCRNGWHTVGTRIRSALGSSSLSQDHALDAAHYMAGPALPSTQQLPIVKALQQANQLLELVTPKLQALYDDFANGNAMVKGDAMQTVLDVAKLFGVTLRTGEQQHG